MIAKNSLCWFRNILVFSRRLRFPIAVFVSITFPSESEGPTNHAPRYISNISKRWIHIYSNVTHHASNDTHSFDNFSDSFDSTFDSTLPSCNIMTLKLDITYFIGMITPLFSRVVLIASLLKLMSLCSCVIFTNMQRVIQI